ncbi:MAG TPA: DnaJ family domain-containing protein [Pyrinomonadaceae bacterium]|nr:DnaJ family domain-containing protein [Pyrinomonadaceae bacterium]
MNRLETLVEKKIREAMEKGEFDNLPGKGEPIDLSENPFENPELRMVHKLLREAGFAPAWIEERKDIEAELEKARTILARGRKLFVEESKVSQWERVVREFREKISELNARVKIYNLKVPAVVFQRGLIDVNAEIKRTGE